jgi:hypothetical protein
MADDPRADLKEIHSAASPAVALIDGRPADLDAGASP